MKYRYYVSSELTLFNFLKDVFLTRSCKEVFYMNQSCLMKKLSGFFSEKYKIKKINYIRDGYYDTRAYSSLLTELVTEIRERTISSSEVKSISDMIGSNSNKETCILLNRTIYPLLSPHQTMINFIYGLSMQGSVMVNSREIYSALPIFSKVAGGSPIYFRKKFIPFEFSFKEIWLNIWSKIREKLKNKINDTDIVEGTVYETAFFPHFGLYYGELYKKSDFYCSSLKQESTIHIETTPVTDFIRDTYKKEKSSFEVWSIKPNAPQILKKSIRIFRETLFTSKRHIFFRLLVKSVLLSKLENIKSAVSRHPELKLACVEFDLLFDPTISFGLRLAGVKVIGRQARPICAYLADYRAMIFDSYFVVDPIIEKILHDSKNTSISCTKVEPFKIDVFLDEKEKNSYLNDYREKSNLGFEPKSIILCLDYHSSLDEDSAHPIATVPNNLVFYTDIISIAKKKKDTLFIIRGKNVAWKSIKDFSAVINEIDSLSNLVIDVQYDVFRHTEKLLYYCDAIIAKYTTVVEAAKYMGIPFLVHDYGVNYKKFFSIILQHHDSNVFCHSNEELNKKLDEILHKSNRDESLITCKVRESNAISDHIGELLSET